MQYQKTFERIAIFAALASLIAVANADDMPTLPVVKAVPSDLGGEVICYGMECANMLDSIYTPPPLFPLEFEWIDPEPTTVDHEQFCRELAALKPAGCNASNPPSTPRTDPNWQPNGCGDGSFISDIANFIVAQGYPESGGNGLSQPAYDVNFKSACDAHDLCYGLLSGKATCDTQFRSNLRSICSSSSNFACNGIADVYFYAVDRAGASAYNNSTLSYSCAVWSAEMKDNGCQ